MKQESMRSKGLKPINPRIDYDGFRVYVNKYHRTEEAILFQLSNSCLQVIFDDGNEICFFGKKCVRCVDKQGKAEIVDVADVFEGAESSDIKERVLYSKEIVEKWAMTEG
mmetsp:Transcript_11492/g.16332  ORF Transcript_11492/g.16332 Transcript_11492/m.16332 type:complete len:110 (-) Transcript_11492:31-360(-)